MAMIPLRRAQMLTKQSQWSDAMRSPPKSKRIIPDFAQQYEADYLMGRCLANQADFERPERRTTK